MILLQMHEILMHNILQIYHHSIIEQRILEFLRCGLTGKRLENLAEWMFFGSTMSTQDNYQQFSTNSR